MGTSLRIACCQLSPDVPIVGAGSRARPGGDRVRRRDGAQIVVLPELCNSGYVFTDAEEVEAAAVTPDGVLLGGWIEEAARGDALVVGGFCERAPRGRLYNNLPGVSYARCSQRRRTSG